MTGPPVSLEGRTVRLARTGTVVSAGPRLGEGGQDRAGAQPWVMRPDGDGAKTVEPGSRLAVRAMTIDFGQARGRIVGIQTAGTPRGDAPAGRGER